MKNKLTLFFILLSFSIFSSCHGQIKNQTNNSAIRSLIESYIDFWNEKNPIDKEKEIIVIGTYEIANENSYWVNVYFINPELLSGLKYSNIYNFNGYKMIIDETLDKTEMLTQIFKNNKINYENFNLAKLPYSVNLQMWRVSFNKKSEVLQISPQEKAGIIKNILEKKGLVFSKNYIE